MYEVFNTRTGRTIYRTRYATLARLLACVRRAWDWAPAGWGHV